MKEFEATQEIVLLKDQITIAATRGLDFQDEESSEKCAKVLKEAVDGVEMMLEVDCDDPAVRIQARDRMHKLIYYKTMMSSNLLRDTELDYCKHVCELLPDISWLTYVRCIKECGWIDLVEEQIASEESHLGRTCYTENILSALRGVKLIPDFLEMYYAMLKQQLELINGETDVTNSMVMLRCIVKKIIYLNESYEKTITEDIVKQCIISSVHFLVFLCKNVPLDVDEMKIEREISFHHLVTLLKKMIQNVSSASDRDVIYTMEYGAEAIRGILAKQDNSQSLSSFLSFVEKWKMGQSGDGVDAEKQLDIYMESITKRDDVMQEAAIEYLLENLELNVNPSIVTCLHHNSDALKPDHVFALLLQTEHMEDSFAAEIQKIVSQTFTDWDFNTQDTFRGDWHLKYGFKEFVFVDTDFSESLTEAINMLSSSPGQESSVAKEISLLCLQSPVVTLTKLFDFSVQSGQADTAALIFAILKASFCFVEKGVNFSLQCLTNCLKSKELSSQELASLMNLVEALFRVDVMDPAQVVSTVIIPNLPPSHHCHRFLHLLWVVLKHGDGTAFEQAFKAISLPVAAVLLCKLLHYCMAEDLAELAKAPWDVYQLKEQLIEVLNLMLDRMRSNDDLAYEVHRLCWLWTKVKRLDSIIIPYLLASFASRNLETKCRKLVQQMSQPCLLLCCMCQKGKDSIILSECRKLLTTDRNTLTSTIVTILPRLVSSEVASLLQELAIVSTNTFSNVDYIPLVSINYVLDALKFLSKQGHRKITRQQWNHTAQICIKGFSAFLSHHQPIPSRSLACLASLISHSAEESTSTFRSAVGMFLLDLLGKSQPSENGAFTCIRHAINRLGDDKLTNQVHKIFESKCYS